MSKKIHSIIYVAISIILIFLLRTEVFAASATMSATSTEIKPGITVTITADIKSAASWQLDISTTGGTLQKNDSRVGNTESGNNENKTVTLGTFTTDKEGTYKITLSGYVIDGNTLSKTNVSGEVNILVANPAPVVTPPDNSGTTTTTKSTDAVLQRFGIKEKDYDFSGFSKNREKEEWSASKEVPNNVTSVTVYAEARDSKAKVSGAGKITLKEGLNVVKITVTAEAGNTKTYKLNITRKTADNTTEEPTQNGSSEARLKTLGINPIDYDFKGFKKDTMSYTHEVPNEISEIEVYAEAVDSKATVNGIGKVTLQEGLNTINVEVIAEDGKTKKTYTLEITRAVSTNVTEEPNQESNEGTTAEKFGLSKLEITGLTLSPKFNIEDYEYTVGLKEDLQTLDITAKANKEGATIEIIGNENLKQGENTITILVTNVETEEVATYQVVVNKNVVEQVIVAKVDWLKPSTWGMREKILVTAAAVLFVVIIVAIILKVRLSKSEMDEMEFPGAEELDRALAEHQELTTGEEFYIKYEDKIFDFRQDENGYDNEPIQYDKPRRKGKHF